MVQSTTRALTLSAVLLMAGVVSLLAQEPGGGAAQPPSAAPTVARGELVKVDTTAKVIAIRGDAGRQMQFSYTDATKVTGADESIAGLATMKGAPVTVHYTKQGQADVATHIEVEKKP